MIKYNIKPLREGGIIIINTHALRENPYLSILEFRGILCRVTGLAHTIQYFIHQLQRERERERERERGREGGREGGRERDRERERERERDISRKVSK